MSQKMLVTNFNYSVSLDEYKQMAAEFAEDFANVPGCLWMIWTVDDDKQEAGAVFLFKNDEGLQQFKSSELVAAVLSHPALSNFNGKETDILTGASDVTRAPIHDEVMQNEVYG